MILLTTRRRGEREIVLKTLIIHTITHVYTQTDTLTYTHMHVQTLAYIHTALNLQARAHLCHAPPAAAAAPHAVGRFWRQATLTKASLSQLLEQRTSKNTGRPPRQKCAPAPNFLCEWWPGPLGPPLGSSPCSWFLVGADLVRALSLPTQVGNPLKRIGINIEF